MAVNSSIIKMRMKELQEEVSIFNNRINMLTHEIDALDKVLRDYAKQKVKEKIEQRGAHGEEKQTNTNINMIDVILRYGAKWCAATLATALSLLRCAQRCAL